MLGSSDCGGETYDWFDLHPENLDETRQYQEEARERSLLNAEAKREENY